MARLFPFRPDSAEVSQEPRLVNLEDTGADDVFAALSSDTARTILARLYEEPGTATDVSEAADTSLQNARYHLDKLSDAGLIEEVDTWYSSRGTEMTVYAPTNEPLVVAAGREESTGVLRDALKRILGSVGVLGLASLFVDRIARTAMIGGDELAPGSGTDASLDRGAAGDGNGGDSSGDEAFQGEEAFDVAGNETATGTPTPAEETRVENLDLAIAGPSTGDSGGTSTPEASATKIATDSDATRTVEAELEATPQATNASEVYEATSSPTAEPTATAATDPGVTPTTVMADGGSLADVAAGISPGALFFTGGLLMIALAVGWWYAFRYRPAFA